MATELKIPPKRPGPPAWRRAVVLAMAPLAGSACDVFGPTVCTTEFVFGVEVTVVDAVDGAPVSEDLSGILVDGSYVEEMTDFGEGMLVGAGERPGDYAVVITATGYEPWGRTGVRVREGECHVSTARLTAELTPAS